MKKVILSLAVLVSSVASAQLLNVGSIEKVNLPAGVDASQAVISHDGTFAVISDANGLSKVDIATGKTTQFAKGGSVSGLTISQDGSTVVFRQSSMQGKLRYTSLKSVDLNNGKETVLVQPTRNLQGFNIVGNRVNAVEKGKLSTKALSATASASAPVATINRGALNVTVDGVTKNISPQGTSGQSYLWPSVSPDGKKVLYYLVGSGAYVCNIDGSNPVKVGWLRAAKWYDNNTVVGMQDQDNGNVVTASKLVAASLDGSVKQDLTAVSSMAMYPSVAGNGERIAFSTPAGELFILNVNK